MQTEKNVLNAVLFWKVIKSSVLIVGIEFEKRQSYYG